MSVATPAQAIKSVPTEVGAWVAELAGFVQVPSQGPLGRPCGLRPECWQDSAPEAGLGSPLCAVYYLLPFPTSPLASSCQSSEGPSPTGPAFLSVP